MWCKIKAQKYCQNKIVSLKHTICDPIPFCMECDHNVMVTGLTPWKLKQVQNNISGNLFSIFYQMTLCRSTTVVCHIVINRILSSCTYLCGDDIEYRYIKTGFNLRVKFYYQYFPSIKFLCYFLCPGYSRARPAVNNIDFTQPSVATINFGKNTSN